MAGETLMWQFVAHHMKTCKELLEKLRANILAIPEYPGNYSNAHSYALGHIDARYDAAHLVTELLKSESISSQKILARVRMNKPAKPRIDHSNVTSLLANVKIGDGSM